MATYEVRAVDMEGTSYGTFANAEPVFVTDELNTWQEAEFTCPILDAPLLASQLLGREVQIRRDGVLIFWGVPVRARPDARQVTFTCYGLMWYIYRLFWGPVQGQSLLNADFESGLTSWTAVNCTATATTAVKALGTTAARLVQASADVDAYLTQTFPWSTIEARTFVIKGWFWIDPSVTWDGPAFGERGLYVERHKGGVLDESSEQFPAIDWVPITNDTPRGKWQRFEIESTAPVPFQNDYSFEVRLYCPGGAIVWDATSASSPEATFTMSGIYLGQVEVRDFLDFMVTHPVQGFQSVANKSDLNIGYAGDVTGQVVERVYSWFEHGNIGQAFDEFPDTDLSDLAMTWDAAGLTRTLRSYYPRKGSHKPLLQIDSSNLSGDFSGWDVDATQTATSVRVLGQGDGPDREIGVAADASGLGGLVLERVVSASQEATIDTLDRLAALELARAKVPVKVPEVTVRSFAHVTTLEVGDTIPLVIDYGWVQEAVTYRCRKRRLDCRTEELTVSLQAP